jgi:DNA-directed RNA polymerase sigma subunit (sigma70/sigma32)
MPTKDRASTTTLTTTSLRQALVRAVPSLEADAEKVLRMRHGASGARSLVLEQVGQDHPETAERLMSIEVELLRQWRERQAALASVKAPSAPARELLAPNPRRDRIVQALRTKKSR